LGFAVHRPAHRSASPRRHGTPCRDVLGRVHIRMIEMFADATAKNRLALTILRIAMPTSITGLGRVRGLDLFYAARGLFLQPGYQPAPSGRMDGAVESGLGPDVPPRKLPSAASRTNQIPDLQILDADDIESAGQIGGKRFDPILTPVDLPGLQPGDRGLDALPSDRTPLGTGQLPPQPQQAPFFGHAQARCHQKIASRQGGRHGDTPIDADDLTVTRSVKRLRDSGEGDVPAIRRVSGDAVRPHAVGDGPGPMEPHPADLGNPYLAHLARHSPCIPLLASSADDPESFMPTRFAPRRPAVRPGEEIRHRLGEVPEHLLLHGLGTGCQPREFSSGFCKSGMRTVLQQRLFLGGRRLKAKPHMSTLSTVTDKRRRERRFPPTPEVGVSTPRIP
jgi:hypothetical protein